AHDVGVAEAVAPPQPRRDLGGILLMAGDAEIDHALVVGDLEDRLLGRDRSTVRLPYLEAAPRLGVLPGRIVEVPIELDVLPGREMIGLDRRRRRDPPVRGAREDDTVAAREERLEGRMGGAGGENAP